MDQIASLQSKPLYEQVIPTSEICAGLLAPRASLIKGTTRETFSYGPHERHNLDLYTPSTKTRSQHRTGNLPLLVFLYGGGFASGDKLFDLIDDDLVYANLGSFFAEELGYMTAVINYRLTKHGARFPRGAEDLDMALKWLDEHCADQGERNLYIMGNSAGGIHVTTWLFRPEYQQTLHFLLKGASSLKLKAAITLGCPFIWPKLVLDSKVGDSVKGYYGNEEEVQKNAALVLAQHALANARNSMWPPIVTVVSELDPKDIRDSGKDFVDLWNSAGQQSEYHVLEGHNHFSTVWALRSGVPECEKWAYDLDQWLQKLQ